jgi:hypothetical protein
MRDGRLEGVEAVVERQQRMPAKGYDDRLVLQRQNRGMGLLWPGWNIGYR